MTMRVQSQDHAGSLPLDKGGPEGDTPEKREFSTKQLVLGAIFGVLFGFLLQKGGVAKYHVLVGTLLLEDFTVVKVMLTAIIVGSIGIFSLHALGLVKLHIKPTRYAANILGGLLFGVGFSEETDVAGNARTSASSPHEATLMVATRMRDSVFKRGKPCRGRGGSD